MGSGTSKSKDGTTVRSVLVSYQINSNFTFSASHGLYTDNYKIFENIPPPKPAGANKEKIFNQDDFLDIDRKAEQAPSKLLDKPYIELINHLTEGLDTDLAKVRALYRWITAQPVDMLLAPRIKPSSNKPMYHIWRIKHKEGNYAQWFATLCRLSNLACTIIHGRLKGSNYQVGDKISDDDHYGEWNAVLVDGVWRFVDAYWGACAAIDENNMDVLESETTTHLQNELLEVDERDSNVLNLENHKKYKNSTSGTNDKIINTENSNCSRKNGSPTDKDVTKTIERTVDDASSKTTEAKDPAKTLTYICDEDYFLPNPKQLIYSHFPETLEWQLLKEPWNLEKFESCANVKDRLFNLGMTLDSHKQCVVNSESGDLEILLGIPPEEGLNYKFQFILFKLDSTNQVAPQYNRNVFMHRPIEKSFSLNIRAPSSGIFRLELVGRDVRIIKPNYDYDWIVIYKLNFDKASLNKLSFPSHPDSGWGPASHTQIVGLSPISNKTGEVRTTTTGDAQVSFKMTKPEEMETAKITGNLFDSNGKEIPNTVVHRLEDHKLVFNVKTPRKGEYSLRLFIGMEDGSLENFCNYFLISNQRHSNAIYPEELKGRIGKWHESDRVGLKPISHPSAIISTDSSELLLKFAYTSEEQLFHSFVANETFNSPHCFEDSKENQTVTYQLCLPKTGVYGFKLGVKDKDVIKPLFDYAITYSSGIPASSTYSVHSEESEEDILKRSLSLASDAHDEDELETIRRKLKKMKGSDWAVSLLVIVETELDVLRIANSLIEALNFRHIERTKDALKHISQKNYNNRMKEEIQSAKDFLARHDHIMGLLHKVLDLDKSTVSEIRAYSNPPESIHRVLMATLLLLGHYEDETKKWASIQIILGKTGAESVKRQIQAFDINALQLDVAVGAKKILGELTLDDIRIKSAGAAAFFVWVKGVITETETRHSEEMEQTLPRTRKKKMKKKTIKKVTNLDKAKSLYG